MKKRGMFGWSILLVALVIMTGCGSKDKAVGGKNQKLLLLEWKLVMHLLTGLKVMMQMVA